MANRRMLNKTVVESDPFFEMPADSQALYMHLVLNADDEGFVGNPETIRRMTGFSKDSLKLLIAKGFLISFQSGVVVVTHWEMQNKIQPSRKTKTIFTDEKGLLIVDEQGKYLIFNNSSEPCQQDADKMSEECQRVADKTSEQVSIGKDSIGKDNINIITPETDKSAPEGTGILIPLQDKTSYDVPADKIPMWKQAYPAVDIKQELWKIVSWCDANPKKRKTRRGIERFITGWLERAQNRGGYYRPTELPERPNSLPYRESDVITIEPGPKLTQEELDAMEPLVIPDNL